MTLEQRAQQFWSVLVFAAREQKVVSYSMLAQLTGCFEDPAPILYCIYCYCLQQDFPPLNAIVIDPVTGHPGVDCPRDYREWSTQHARVFLHDWLEHPAPSEEVLEQALAKQEELEMANAGYVALPC